MSKRKSLYDRLGGIYSIAAVIDHFSDTLIHNPIVGQESKNPFLAQWHTEQLDRLPGLKWMRTLWVASISGGPYTFVPTQPGMCPFSLENAHIQFQISPDEFNEVANELARALAHFNVPEKEGREVLAVFLKHKPDVTEGYQLAHDLPLQSISCPFSQGK